ncbi:MAG: ParA family protein, partial [Actinobacteria bacterium]|nr:ParA family protein [Actinomycetota bacterium]
MTATVYVVANQKGGVAKTTTTLSLAAALTERGQAVLVVDLDPQAALTFALGYDPDGLTRTVHDVVTGRAGLADVILRHPETDLAPANIDLAAAEVALLARTGREYVLRAGLEPLRDVYDTILVDCPPSLGVLTLNGLTAADRALVPLQCETLSHRAVSQLLETIADVQRLTNRGLQIAGILPTMFDARTRHARDVLADVRQRYGLPVLEPPVRKSVRFAEAPNAGVSILAYDDSVPGAAAYRAVGARLAGLEVPERLLEAAGASPARVAAARGRPEEPG